MSGQITLGLLSAAMLTAGCGRSTTTTTTARPGRVFYDANHTPVPRNLWVDAAGRPVPLFDGNGNPVPENEVLVAYNAAGTTTTTRTTSYSTGYHRSVWWGPSFYVPGPHYTWGPTYSPAQRSSAPSAPGRTYFGGSRPNTSPAPTFGPKASPAVGSKPAAPSSGGSVSRGGFGGTGAHAGGSAAS